LVGARSSGPALELLEHLDNGRNRVLGERQGFTTRFGKGGDEFSLPLWLHGPIAGERREDVVVLKILAPRLELLGRPADFLAQVNECVPHAVRIEVRQADIVERLPEDLANGRCGLPAYADYFEFINDPRQAFRTMTLPFEGGLEFTVRVR
jgi:hypothetical protein